MKARNTFLFIPLIALMGLTMVSADVTQHPSYPFDESNSWIGSPIGLSADTVLVSHGAVSQHPFYPFDNGNYWTDAKDGGSQMSHSLYAQFEEVQHPFYLFDEEPRL